MADNESSRQPNGAPLHDGPNHSPHTCPDPTTVVSKQQLKDLINDDFYKAICRHFLMTGKGRRPDLPFVDHVTHKLLLQLFFLREQADTSYKELKSWLERLAPTTSSVSHSRISHKVTSTFNSCQKMTREQAQAYIEGTVDFHQLSPPLAALQLTRLHLVNVETYNQPPSDDICNDVVIALEHFRSSENKPAIFVRKWIKELSLSCANLSESTLKSKVQSAIKTYKDLNNKKKAEAVNDFLKSNFTSKFILLENVSNSNVQDTKIKCSNCSELKEDIRQKVITLNTQGKEKEKLLNSIKTFQSELSIKDQVLSELQKEKSYLILELSELRNEIPALKKEIRMLQENNADLTNKLDVSSTKLFYKRNIELKKENDELKDRLEELSCKNSALLTDLNAEISSQKALKEKWKSEQTLKSKYKKEAEAVKKEKERCMHALHSLKEDEINLKEKRYNAYAYHVRQLYMSLLGETNVVSDQASKLVQLVAKHLFNKDISIDDLPSSSTCLNFMDEGHHIAKQQIVESLCASEHFTFASDGTSRQKKHYMEHHLVLDNGATLSVGFSEVADDKAETLFKKSIDLLEELTDTYLEAEDHLERTQVFTDMLKKMKGLMSDRAANMKLFNKKMLEFKKDKIGADASIEFLYCNAHFLIALADATEKAIKCEESLLSEQLGRDRHGAFSNFSSCKETSAFRLIRTAADVFGPRGDEKNGCREE